MRSHCEVFIHQSFISQWHSCHVCSRRYGIPVTTIVAYTDPEQDPVNFYTDSHGSLKIRSECVDVCQRVRGIDNCRTIAFWLLRNFAVYLTYRQFIVIDSVDEGYQILNDALAVINNSSLTLAGALKLGIVEIDGVLHIEVCIATECPSELEHELCCFYMGLGFDECREQWAKAI